MTMWSTVFPSRPADFDDGLVVVRRDRMSKPRLLRTLWSARDGDGVLLNGAMGFEEQWIDLLLGLAVRARGRAVTLLISDATWHSRSTPAEARVPALHGPVERFGKLLLHTLARGRRTHVCFLSRAEVADFVRTAGIPAERVHFTPFFPSLEPEDLAALPTGPPTGPPYVFSGGSSSRDHELLSTALGGAPWRVVVATRAKRHWPDNFEVAEVPHPRFVQLMAGSAVVVTALDARTSRGTGQQTYLNAMELGVPVVVNDAVGVRDYIQDGVNGLVVPAQDSAALRDAVAFVLDPANRPAVDRMVEQGCRTAAQLSADQYWGGLKRLLFEVHGGVGSAG